MDQVLEQTQRRSEQALRSRRMPELLAKPYGWKKDQADSKIEEFELLKRLEPKRYAYFMRTKLKDILALQGVKIPSDKEYMEYYEQVSKQVQDWHKDRDYYEYKKKWLLDHYSKTEILDAVHHLGENNLLYPLEQLEKDYE